VAAFEIESGDERLHQQLLHRLERALTFPASATAPSLPLPDTPVLDSVAGGLEPSITVIIAPGGRIIRAPTMPADLNSDRD